MDHERQAEVSGEGRRVLGIDAAGRLGWVGVLLLGERFADARIGTAKDLIEWAEPVAVIAMDIPIGNMPGASRLADSEARRIV